MNAKLLIVAAAAVLAGCNALQGVGPAVRDPRVTSATVEEGYIVLDQEPIVVRSTGAKIIWRIATQGYEFPANGITFKQPTNEIINCGPTGGPHPIMFQCTGTKATPKAKFPYTINIIDSSNPSGPPLSFDPTVMND
ncbi:MAG TPA: hypothetical protein VF936_05135 [Burkholderiales bacterium]